MSELTVILLGLLFISCPVTLFIGLVGGIVIYRTLLDRGRENGNHKKIMTLPINDVPSGEVYHTIKRWLESGWDCKVVDSKSVGNHNIILSRIL